MQLFTCAACQQVLHFENSICTRCGHTLAFLPESGRLAAVDPVADQPGLFVVRDAEPGAARYRLCGNYIDHGACNWGVVESDDNRFCRACRLNDIIPNLADPRQKTRGSSSS